MASNSRPGRILLSEKLRGMRFMKQKDEATLRDKLAAEKRARDKAAHWVVEGAEVEDDGRPLVLTEEGVGEDTDAWRGRRSFGGANALIEKKRKEKKVAEKKEKTDVKEDGETEVEDMTTKGKKDKMEVEKVKAGTKRQAGGKEKDRVMKKPRVEVVDLEAEEGEIIEDVKPPQVGNETRRGGKYNERKRALWKGLKGGISKKEKKKGKKLFRYKAVKDGNSFQSRAGKKNGS